MDLTVRGPFNDRLSELYDSGKSARLSDLTDFDWDEVHLFHEGTPRDRIEEITGEPVIRGKYYDYAPTLLVFENHGEVVKAIAPPGDFLRGQGNRTTWPSDVLLEPWGAGGLLLTLPPGTTPGKPEPQS